MSDEFSRMSLDEKLKTYFQAGFLVSLFVIFVWAVWNFIWGLIVSIIGNPVGTIIDGLVGVFYIALMFGGIFAALVVIGFIAVSIVRGIDWLIGKIWKENKEEVK